MEKGGSLSASEQMEVGEREKLLNGARTLGFEIQQQQIDVLLTFLDDLEETNKSFNITRIPRSDYVTLHLLDSLTALRTLPQDRPLRIIDVGTGGGFPGVPLAALRPDCQMTLLDSTRKKVSFAEGAAHRAGIANCVGIHGRAEDLAKDNNHRASYDVVISRAVAAFPKLMSWLLPLAKVGGTIIAMKGADYESEIAGSDAVLRSLGGRIDHIEHIPLPETEILRHIIVVTKIR